MASSERRGLLNETLDDPPSIPTPEIPNPVVTTPPMPADGLAHRFSVKHRPGYARIPSVSFREDVLGREATESASNAASNAPLPQDGSFTSPGFGTAGLASSSTHRISLPPSNRESQAMSGADEMGMLPSAPSTGGWTGSAGYDQSFGDLDTSYSASRHTHKSSRASMSSTVPPSIYARSDGGLVSVRSRYENFEPAQNCQSTRSVRSTRFRSWGSIIVVILAIFSTSFSAIFLVLALRSPRWGSRISSRGDLTPTSAAFLTSLFAKLIELSFVTVVVAFVGQALARRAFKLENARGVTLAELSMRTWIMQPGIMFVQWESVRYAGISTLGIISLLAAILAVLYTSAATALVQPQLKFPNWRDTTVRGTVNTSFANKEYIQQSCQTPITWSFDPPQGTQDARLSSCVEIEHAAMAYHNFHTWVTQWATYANSSNRAGTLDKRPQGYALFNDNTTITAPWIERQNVSTVSGLPGRYINNVTMAMPHVGVVKASMDPSNRLMQPTDIPGATLNLNASVPSPIMNTLCVTMHKEDLKPFVYAMWDDVPGNLNLSIRPYPYDYNGRDPYLNGTQFDDTFGWGVKYGVNKTPPVFPKLPIDYNTIINDTTGTDLLGRKTIFLLGKGGQKDYQGNDVNETNYALCQLQVGFTPDCSTTYTASDLGAELDAVCEAEGNRLQYSLTNSDSSRGNDTLSADWPGVGAVWATSMSLDNGVFDGDASDARMLTGFIATGYAEDPTLLNPTMPSLAEALSVLAGCTLIESANDASFTSQDFNYTSPTGDNILNPGVYEYFKASVQDEQYISGGNLAYQKAFYVVLFAVVIMNVVILAYFIIHKDWYSDFSEPMALFSLAVNSPPSEKLAGSCGNGPSGDQYKVSWKLNNEDGHFFIESQDKQPPPGYVNVESPRLSRQRWTQSFEMVGAPMNALKTRFSRVDPGEAIP